MDWRRFFPEPSFSHLPTRHYLYVSDAKVEMLLAQIETKWKRNFATELKLDLQVLSASVRHDGATVQESRYARLAAVVRHLTEREGVGDIASHSQYVAGTLDFQWAVAPDKDPEIVVWCAKLKEAELTADVVMVGSPHHVVGAPSGRFGFLGSTGGALHRLITHRDSFEAGKVPIPSLLEELFQGLRGPWQRMEFVAKTLARDRGSYGSQDGTHRILLSPIYVALT